MDGQLGAWAPHVAALLVGGLGVSLGATFWARSARGSALLARASGGTVTAGVCAALFIGPAAAYVLLRDVVTSASTDIAGVPPIQLLLIGVAIGLPMGVPGMLASRSDARRREAARQKRREYVPNRDDRRVYAASIARQITELSPTPREITARITGDGGTTLRLEGPIDATEGERLTRALCEDLADVGFKRVEGSHGGTEWWSRVQV
jgi:hypothetical protein